MRGKILAFLGVALLLGASVAQGQTSATGELKIEATAVTEHAYAIAGETFVLDGSRSTDDGVVRSFDWKQVSGPYRFTLPTGAKVSVVPSLAGTYVFELVATDSAGRSTTVQKVQLDVSAGQATTTTGGTEDINIGVGEAKKKGNVEFEWKVEEGESAPPAPSEIDSVKNESADSEAARANDRLVNAGPQNGWPASGIRVSAGDVNGLTDAQKQERLAAVKAWAEVKSGQELENFAAGVLLKDVQLKGVNIKENAIEVEYSMPAKLFAIFSMRYTAQVSINKGNNDNWDFGSVKVKFPWYAFLLRKGMSVEDLTSAIQQSASVEGEVSAKTEDQTEKKEGSKEQLEIQSWSFGAAAKTISLISNVLKTKHDTAKNSIGNIR